MQRGSRRRSARRSGPCPAGALADADVAGAGSAGAHNALCGRSIQVLHTDSQVTHQDVAYSAYSASVEQPSGVNQMRGCPVQPQLAAEAAAAVAWSRARPASAAPPQPAQDSLSRLTPAVGEPRRRPHSCLLSLAVDQGGDAGAAGDEGHGLVHLNVDAMLAGRSEVRGRQQWVGAGGRDAGAAPTVAGRVGHRNSRGAGLSPQQRHARPYPHAPTDWQNPLATRSDWLGPTAQPRTACTACRWPGSSAQRIDALRGRQAGQLTRCA